ncbi:unnamed protein product [Fraxinus pennsylvanica]|uniref:Retrotransposon gag domain-containing protein n=1 Tax=Fraxinus pennsylvanica TaxID=56036 RepID=A0AAD1Z318_9LAMI|nr:unnamed protein product [Fraxinus pennsylvanica]
MGTTNSLRSVGHPVRTWGKWEDLHGTRGTINRRTSASHQVPINTPKLDTHQGKHGGLSRYNFIDAIFGKPLNKKAMSRRRNRSKTRMVGNTIETKSEHDDPLVESNAENRSPTTELVGGRIRATTLGGANCYPACYLASSRRLGGYRICGSVDSPTHDRLGKEDRGDDDPEILMPEIPRPMTDLERKIEEMMTQKIDDALTKRKDRRRQMVFEEDPFVHDIMSGPLPKGFKQPIIEAYDGVTDPLDHLRTFVDLMRLYVALDVVMCRSFPPTLRREARDWVATLVPRSIKTFHELSRSFVAYFMSSKRKRKTTIRLMQVVQDKHESLQEYLARFSRATLGIRELQISAVGDTYDDAEEVENVTENLIEGWEAESHKLKSGDEPKLIDKGKSRNERISKGYIPDRSIRQRREEVKKKARFNQIITFGEDDFIGLVTPHDDALVVVDDIVDYNVKIVLVDGGSASNILTWEVFVGLKISLENLKAVSTPLLGFRGATVIPEGVVELPVTLGTYPVRVVILMNFLVVKTPMTYNAIYGRPLLNAAGANPSTYYQVMKFSTSRGVGCVKGDQQFSRKCYVNSIQSDYVGS